jgi:Fic family protein
VKNPKDRKWLEPFRQSVSLTAPEYGAAFSPALPRRTALNRLQYLRSVGMITLHGATRSSFYALTMRGELELEEKPSAALREEPAQGAGDPRVLLRKPLFERKPVGYHMEFLESYQPNVSFYLPLDVRDHLHEIGKKTGMYAEPAGTYARHICQRLLIDLSWNSSRLEGNTFSLLETEQLLQAGAADDRAQSHEAIMILNHKAAIEFLLESIEIAAFDHRTILNLHALLTADLLQDASAEGALRTVPVGIGRSCYLPTAIPAKIEACFDLILAKAQQIQDPFEQAFFAMVQMPYLQPFLDGNKRVSRLIANLPLFQRNLSPLSFVGVSERDYTDGMLAVYELNDVSLLREVFVHAYERSTQRYTVIRGAIGEPDAFRVKYRQSIAEQVAAVVRARCTRREAVALLRRWAEEGVVETDRKKFVAVTEEVLAGLHEGNFARYRIRPAEFDAWHALWHGA